MDRRTTITRAALAAAASLGLLAGTAQAAVLTVGQNANVAAGIAAFGPAKSQILWKDLFAPATTWSAGSLGASVGGASQTDPTTGSSVTGNLAIANWIEGTGFNDGPGGVGPDLAINGAENFTLHFAAPVTRIGLAAATGLGNLPTEFDHLGALFNLTASNGDTGVLSLVDTGNGYAAFVTISSATPFTSIAFTEPSGNIKDQYFGDVFSAGVPEPAAWSLMILGFGLAGAALRRREASAAA